MCFIKIFVKDFFKSNVYHINNLNFFMLHIYFEILNFNED